MSENNDTEQQLLENSEAVENGDGEPVEQKQAPLEDSNGPVYADSSLDQMREVEPLHMNHVDSKEDMFMDASDELNADNKEAGTATEPENNDVLEDKLEEQAREFGEIGNGVQSDNHFVVELERLHALLQQAVGDKERIEEEKEALAREIHVKEQEIEGLNAKVTELSAASDTNSAAIVADEAQIERGEHVEVVAERILSALALVVDQGQLMDDSGGEKIALVEKGALLLIDKYGRFLHEIEQLRQSLSNVESDLGVQEEFVTVFSATRDELLELRRKEAELMEKLGILEDENRKLVEQVESEKASLETMDAELGKAKVELEQEKVRCANTKEKLSMAVTKGKALVQQRDLLKQSLADKTSELERYLVELQEKSAALEAAELTKEELVKSKNLIASLQETLSEKSLILETFEHIILQIDVPEEIQSVDIVGRARWLVNERNELKRVSLDFYKLKEAISSIDLPENVSFSDLESRFSWLKESFYQAKEEINMLHDEIARTSQAGQNEIDRLNASFSAEVQEKNFIHKELDSLASKFKEIADNAEQMSLEKDHLIASLSAELQEKDYIQKELDDLSSKYENVVEKACQVSSEKDQLVKMLLEASGIGDQDGISEMSSNLYMLIDRCIGKIKEQTSSCFDTPLANAELLQRLQTLLYVKHHELFLCEEILEQDLLVRSELNDLSNELRVTSQELLTLKEERDHLHKDLERSEEKSALLREKLSMAVKKGKGLVQDRENLKTLLEEKNSDIEKLRLELEMRQYTITECRDHINELANDLKRISELEADLATMKYQRDEFEKFLSESNSMLQRVIESIDRIVLPVDSVFEEPVEKVNWLAGYIDDCQHAKTQAEKELRKEKEEASTLASELAEAQAAIKSLEDALSVAKKNISQLTEERSEIEVRQKSFEQELQKAMQEASSQSSKFVEACEAQKSLERTLSRAEDKISVLIKEKEEAQGSQATLGTELEKVREEIAAQTSRIEESSNTIKSLENALSEAETSIAKLTEQNNDALVERTIMERELKILKDETDTLSSKLAEASTTIKSLEEALAKAGNDFSIIEGEKRTAELDISTLNSKLNACMEELAGTSGSLASRSVELVGHLNDLQILVKDDDLLSTVKQCFERNLKGLKAMDLIIKNIRDSLADKDSEAPQSLLVMEEIANVAKLFSVDLEDAVNDELVNGDLNADDVDNISLYFRRTLEGFQMKKKILADRLEGFSNFIEESVAVLLKNLQTTEDRVMSRVEYMESLKQKVDTMEVHEQEKEKDIAMLEKDVAILLSACTDATRDLQFDIKNKLLGFKSVPNLEKLNHGLLPEVGDFVGDDMAEKEIDGSKYVKTAENLLAATRRIQALAKLFESTSEVAATTIDDLQEELKDKITASEKTIEERDLYQSRVSGLERDMEALQDSLRELRLKVKDYEVKEEKWKEKEAELSSLYNSLLMKEQAAEDPLLSASQARTLFNKIREIEIPLAGPEPEDQEPHSSADVKKLFYIIDGVAGLQHQITSLSHEKEELQSTLSRQTLEIEHLKGEIQTHIKSELELEKIKSEFSELKLGIEKVTDLLAGKELVGEQKSADVSGLLLIVEKQVMALLLEAETSKSKAQELDAKLLGSQRVVDELSSKIKFLEDSYQGRTVQPEIVQERSIFEAPSVPIGSEISEIEDTGPLGKKAVSPVPSATHVRTLRKGSTDHLALNIDLESDRLINSEETDEDKGHIFKSLNTSGLIPRQGKLIADRVDGIWVSGGRLLSSRPGARLGVIAYCLFLHLWLLGTIL